MLPSAILQRIGTVVAVLLVLSPLGGCQVSSDAALSPLMAVSGSDATTSLPDSLLTPPNASTESQFHEAMAHATAQEPAASSLGSLMQQVGLHFEGHPYLEAPLDEANTETLAPRFDGFDCVTFVETTLALARGAQVSDTTYAGFVQRLADQRYRNGSRLGYCSRLHYFTDWLAENEARGTVRLLTEELGGRPLSDTLDFMSTHRSSYDRFATNDSLFACIQGMEQRVQERHRRDPVRYVPQDSIRAVYDRLQAGDIVGLVTSIEGLDVAHTGLVFAHDDGGRGLLHASLSEGVMVSPDLQGYVKKIDHQIGMVVARPQPVAAPSASPSAAP